MTPEHNLEEDIESILNDYLPRLFKKYSGRLAIRMAGAVHRYIDRKISEYHTQIIIARKDSG